MRAFHSIAVMTLACVAFVTGSSVPRATVAAADECIACSGGEIVGCAPGSHKAWEDDDDAVYANYAGTHSDCRLGSCSTAHGHCDIEGDELVDSISAAVISKDAASLSEVLGAYPQARLNPLRGSVQIANCDGVLIANLPATADLMDLIADDAEIGTRRSTGTTR